MPDDLAPCRVNHVPSFFSHKFRVEELQEILDSLNVDSAPGPDLINHTILRLIRGWTGEIIRYLKRFSRENFFLRCGKII